PAGGTSGYLAPELLLGERASARSDLYAAGVLFYRALTGRLPWQDVSVEALAGARPPAVPPSQVRADVSPGLDRIVLRLIDLDPARRYADAGAVLAELRAVCGPQAVDRGAPAGAQALFVDRERELERLEQWAVPRTQVGDPPLCLLTGESGIGKTRLAEVLVERVRRRGVRSAFARCREEKSSAFDPALAWLRSLLEAGDPRARDSVEAIRERYGSTLAALDDSFASDGESEPSDRPSAFHMLDSIASALCDLSETRPLLLVLDDIERADPLLVDMLWHLVRRARHLALRLLVIRGQFEEPRSELERFERGVHAEELAFTLELGTLPREAVADLAERRLGRARAAMVTEQLWALTGGHPRYVEEMLREVVEEPSTDDPAAAAERLPGSLQEAVSRRVRRLDEQALEVLVAVLSAGHPVRREELRNLLDDRFVDRIDELVARGFLREGADGRYEEAHSVLRAEVLDAVGRDKRQAWHRRWAEWHASMRSGPVARAAQLIAADAGTTARDELIAAGEHLFESWQFRAAVRFFEAALERMGADDPQRLNVLARLARASREWRDLERTVRVCHEWAELAARLDDRDSEARACGMLAGVLRDLGRWEEAERTAHRAVELADTVDEVETKSLANKVLGSILWERWRHDEAIERLKLAGELSSVRPESLRHAFDLHDLGIPLALRGAVFTALRCNERAGRLFEKLDLFWNRLNEMAHALILSLIGEPDAGIAVLSRALEDLARINVFVPFEVALENLLFLQIWHGRYSDALKTGGRFLEEASRANRNELRVVGLLCLGEVHFLLDEREAARDHHRIARELSVAVGATRQEMFARLALARDHREDGRLDLAHDEAQHVLAWTETEPAPRQRIGAALELARVARLRGDPETALEWVDRATEALGPPSEDYAALVGAISLERALGWESLGKPRRSLAAAEFGLGHVRHRGPVEQEIQLEALRARAFRAEGRDADAVAALHHAAERIRAVAQKIEDPLQRSRYLARPDRAAIVSAARRQREAGADGMARLRGLGDVVHGLSAGASLSDLARIVVETAVRLTDAERGVLLVRRERDARLHPLAAVGLDDDDGGSSILRISERVLAGAEANGAIVAEDLAALGPDDESSSPSISALGIRSAMCVRLESAGLPLGCLYVDARDPHTRFVDSDLAFLRLLADAAAIAISRGATDESVAVSGSTDEADVETFGAMIGRSEAIRSVFATLRRVAASEVPVLLLGESGTGKELAARAIHGQSPRAERPFLSENCAAIPETLLESALFGHVRGAFTGAERDMPGLFERAHGGTLFLDEIGEMSPGLQAKLLRVLQDGEFRRVGGVEPLHADVRLVAATHRDLPRLVSEGQFREDLYFRLAGITVRLPPLRERREDIAPLVRHILRRLCGDLGRPVPELAPDVLRTLIGFDWPGNVRQLENVLRRLLLMTDGDRITRAALDSDPELRAAAGAAGKVPPAAAPGGDDDERARLVRALEETGGRRNDAAALLGMSRATFYRRLKKYGLV
ncbi:MAG: GAF domain-containing protein, partial [Acidobacteria bacterium]